MQQSFAEQHANPRLGFSAVPRWFRRTEFWKSLRVEQRGVLDELYHRMARLPIPRSEQKVDVGVDIGRGQWPITLAKLAEASGATIRQVRTAIERAKEAGVLTHEPTRASTRGATRSPTRTFSLFTWRDFDLYDNTKIESDTASDTLRDKQTDTLRDKRSDTSKTQRVKTQTGKTQTRNTRREEEGLSAQAGGFAPGLLPDEWDCFNSPNEVPGSDDEWPGDSFGFDPEWEEIGYAADAGPAELSASSTALVVSPVRNKAEGRSSRKEKSAAKTSRAADVFKEFTSAQRQHVCSSARAMELALLWGAAGLEDPAPADAAPLDTNWRRFGGTADDPKSDTWDIPAYLGYYWWIVSIFRENRNISLSIPAWGRLAGGLKHILATLPDRRELHRMIQMFYQHFDLIKWMIGGRAGAGLTFDESSLSDTLARRQLNRLLAMSEDEIQEQYATMDAPERRNRYD